MKRKLLKSVVLGSLLFLLSSCQIVHYLFNTPNYSLESINKENADQLFKSLSTSEFKSDELLKHINHELYKDAITVFNSEESIKDNVLYSPLSTFINY